MITEKIKLYDRTYTNVLLETDSREEATEFLMASGSDWIPMVIDYGDNWKCRWSGRLVVSGDGAVVAFDDSQYLKYLKNWPNPFAGAR